MSVGRRARLSLIGFAALVAAACGGAAAGSRSPANDYPPPVAEDSNGEVVGADRVPPGQKLAESPKLGSEGITPAATPAKPETGKPSKPPPKP